MCFISLEAWWYNNPNNSLHIPFDKETKIYFISKFESSHSQQTKQPLNQLLEEILHENSRLPSNHVYFIHMQTLVHQSTEMRTMIGSWLWIRVKKLYTCNLNSFVYDLWYQKKRFDNLWGLTKRVSSPLEMVKRSLQKHNIS